MSRYADILKAFGDDTRLRILRLLDSQELSVSELVNTMELSQSRISRHLGVLRQAGIVMDRREGNWVYYCIARRSRVPLAGAVWGAIRDHWEESSFFPEDRERLRATLARRVAPSKAFFQQVASRWDRIKRTYIDETLSGQAVAELAGPEAVAVDVGTGTGDVLVALARGAREVIGVDDSPRMLEACRRRLAEEGLTNVDLRLGSAEALPLEGGVCDAVFSSMLLHHVSDPAGAIREMARVLKPGGRAVVTDLVKHDLDWTREVMADLWLGFTEQQIRRWMTEAGLGDVHYTAATVPSPVDPDSGQRLRAFLATATKPAA